MFLIAISNLLRLLGPSDCECELVCKYGSAMYPQSMTPLIAATSGWTIALYIVVGSVAICVVGGILIGALTSASNGENPLTGAAAGGLFGALAGLQQGCGCAISLILAGLAIMVGKWILG